MSRNNPYLAKRSSVDCHLYHDYDYLSIAPKQLATNLSFEEEIDPSTSSANLKSVFPGFVVLSLIANLGLQVVLELN
jgi:hypothetical protein